MGSKSAIEWTDATWTPVRARVRQDAPEIALAKGYTSLVQIASKMRGHVGPHCEKVSPLCDNCYSETSNGRCLPNNGTGLPFDRRSRDLVDIFLDERILDQPIHWQRPRKIFVCSQTDLFGDFVSNEFIDRVFGIMAMCPEHTFQILTKRASRMLEYLTGDGRSYAVESTGWRTIGRPVQLDGWPLRNVWPGISVGLQAEADRDIPLLMQTPAALRFVSYEPALGPINFHGFPMPDGNNLDDTMTWYDHDRDEPAGLGWIIAGGESGSNARPSHPDWFRSARDQCQAAGVPYFFKQWGEWVPVDNSQYAPRGYSTDFYPPLTKWIEIDGKVNEIVTGNAGAFMRRVGKKAAGRLLDGREWSEFPEVK